VGDIVIFGLRINFRISVFVFLYNKNSIFNCEKLFDLYCFVFMNYLK